MITESIKCLVEGRSPSCENLRQAMEEIMSGQATNAQTAAFLTALRMKGETVKELVTFAKVMRKNSKRICPNVKKRLVDTCGTGGDQLKTFNISTASAFVASGAGVTIAKHGNRAVTSQSGSADVLEHLGVNLNAEPETVAKTIEQVGIGFLFAPIFHPAMKYAVAPRREMGIRTVFNLLGPLTNPACANAQLLGVYDPKLTSQMAKALNRLGCEEAMVVHGLDGLDEISTIGKTVISHLRNGVITTFETEPSKLGVKMAKIDDLRGSTPEGNAKVLFDILVGNYSLRDPKMEIVFVNSAASIIIGGITEDFKDAMEIARESIRNGSAIKKLEDLIKASGGNLTKLGELEKKNA